MAFALSKTVSKNKEGINMKKSSKLLALLLAFTMLLPILASCAKKEERTRIRQQAPAV
jgi:hypothetical protein